MGRSVSIVGVPVSKRHSAEDWAIGHGLFLALAACFVFWVALGAVLAALL